MPIGGRSFRFSLVPAKFLLSGGRECEVFIHPTDFRIHQMQEVVFAPLYGWSLVALLHASPEFHNIDVT
jgi:hypothetical protein